MSDISKQLSTERDQLNYIFDSRGLYIQRRFLADRQLDLARKCLEELTFTPEPWAPEQHRASGIHGTAGFLGELNNELRCHSTTRNVVGYPARTLESYGLKRFGGRLDLHGGAAEYLLKSNIVDVSARSWVQHGRIYSLRVKVLIYLDDVDSATAGRFCYVEGSHKAEFSFHSAFPMGRTQAMDLIRVVDISAGDAIWLNEALLHGAEQKTSGEARRLLAYTFGPSFMSDWVELDTQSHGVRGYFSTETEHASPDRMPGK